MTYPITTALRGVTGAVAVRGYSMYGDSYVYVVFQDGTDPYWARSRVLELLNQVTSRLPAAARPELGPDATAVGWVYQYALVDRTGTHDLAQLRSLQDWFLKYELQSLPGVSEVATVGGMVKQYQVVIDPEVLRAYDLPLMTLMQTIQRSNGEAGRRRAGDGRGALHDPRRRLPARASRTCATCPCPRRTRCVRLDWSYGGWTPRRPTGCAR